MGLIKKVKNMVSKSDIAKWQERLQKNKAAFEDELSRMDRRDALYNGTNEIKGYSQKAKSSKYVRNVIGEIIEAEVDSSIPLPKVTAKRPEDEQRAATIEAFLRNELDLLPLSLIHI